jgi:hypothetical protein
LSANSQIYIRLDGIDRHREAYAQTALGKIFQGDTGRMLDGIMAGFKDLYILQLLETVAHQGVALGVEMRQLEPPQVQMLAVFPKAATQSAPLSGTLLWAAGKARTAVQVSKLLGREVHQIESGPLHVAWWIEGDMAVLSIGTDKAETVLQRLQQPTPRLVDQPLYQKLIRFQEFKTATRGFIDFAALAKVARVSDEKAARILDELGLAAFQNLTFYYGFDSAATRSLIACEIPGPRKGLARLANGKPFTLGDLPPMPPDVDGFTALRLDPAALFDSGVELAERLVPAGQAPSVKGAVASANEILGLNIREDLLGELGSMVVTYSSPPEGMAFTGQTIVFEVKNAKRLETALDRLLAGLQKLTGMSLKVRQRTYHGVDLRTVHVSEKGFPLVPTYALHKNWLIIGLYPQPVQGFILRAKGELPSWKPGPEVQDALTKLPKSFTLLSLTDPRVGINQLLAMAPLVGGSLHGFNPQISFDVASLPNAHEVARHLFPNVTVASDDGRVFRLQGLASLPVPPGFNRLDTTTVISLGAITTLGAPAQKTFKPVGEPVPLPRKKNP